MVAAVDQQEVLGARVFYAGARQRLFEPLRVAGLLVRWNREPDVDFALERFPAGLRLRRVGGGEREERAEEDNVANYGQLRALRRSGAAAASSCSRYSSGQWVARYLSTGRSKRGE